MMEFVCPGSGPHRAWVRLHLPDGGHHGLFRQMEGHRRPLTPLRSLSANADPVTVDVDAGPIEGGEMLVLLESPVRTAELVEVRFEPGAAGLDLSRILAPFTRRTGALSVVVNPYPYVNYIGFGDAGDVEDLRRSLAPADEIHWEVVRNNCLYPTSVGEVIQSDPDWPAEAPIAGFSSTVDVPGILVGHPGMAPLVCMNRHYHGDVRPFLQTNWAKARWRLLASDVDGMRLGAGHVMDHLWKEVEDHSTALLTEVRQRCGAGAIHLDFTRGVALVGFGAPLRAAWAAQEAGESDLDALIAAANQASQEEGPPFSAWEDPPDGVHQLRCALSRRLLERMMVTAGIPPADAYIRLLLCSEEQHVRDHGIDVHDWILNGVAHRFCFHAEWWDGQPDEAWSLAPLGGYVSACHAAGVECHAGLPWFGTGRRRDASLGMLPGRVDPHHVALERVPAWSAPDPMAIFQWASMCNEFGADGLLLYDVEMAAGSAVLEMVMVGLQHLLTEPA